VPALVNLDGFLLSFTREPVDLPEAEAARRFVGPFEPGAVSFRASRPVSQAVAVLGGGPYSYFRYEAHLAALQALPAYEEIADAFAREFGRRWPAVETYRADDAEIVFFMIGSFATKAKDAVDRLREAGWRIGLVRPRLLRPYPDAALRAALLGKRAVGSSTKTSRWAGRRVYAELASALYGRSPRDGARSSARSAARPRARGVLRDGTGGAAALKDGGLPPPRLLYPRAIREVQAQAIARRARRRGAMSEAPISSMKDLPSTHLLGGGTAMCAGCGGLQAIHEIYDLIGAKSVFVNAAGCMTLLSTYPFTPFRGGWLYTSMASASGRARRARRARRLVRKGASRPRKT
jgi:pyruvate ferredoxin oxidoreductase alpha subunit